MLPLHCQEQIVFYAVHAGYDGLCNCVCKVWKKWVSEVVKKDKCLLLQKIHDLNQKGFGYVKVDSTIDLEVLQWEYHRLQWIRQDAQDEQTRRKQKRLE